MRLTGDSSTLDERAPVADDVVLEVRNLIQEFVVSNPKGKIRQGRVSALADVSLAVRRGETFAIVGETGSGKSTMARAIIGEPPPLSGEIYINSQELSHLNKTERRTARRSVQMVFQDPFSALNPRWTVEKLVGEPLVIQRIGTSRDRQQTVKEILSRVGLSPSRYLDRYPRDLSGGECQRLAIARALILSPDVVICDEPVTALDVSIQAQILNLLADLRGQLHLTYLLIAHDLTVVQALSHRLGTMYLGKLCEVGPTDLIFERPAHPYTAALLSAVPPRPGLPNVRTPIELTGEIPSPIDPPSGCRFHTRCPIAQEICAVVDPTPTDIGEDRSVMCHFPLEIRDPRK
jgi:oligopeptide/dipeptide ABC transporter ATP-binding protein